MDLIRFDKNFVQRYEEYTKIFKYHKIGPILPSEIKEVWSNYFDLLLEPIYWTAVWKISQDSCSALMVRYPKIVVVKVNEVNSADLTANVTIIIISGAEDDNLPSNVSDVPLIDLYPTIPEEKYSNVYETAEVLDQLRVFYQHLWRPWDVDDENESSDWVTSNLQLRLKLYYDLLSDQLHVTTVQTIRSLLDQGCKLYDKIQDIEAELAESSTETELPDEAFRLTQYRAELDFVKNRLICWENPDLRRILNSEIAKTNSEPGVSVVLKDLTVGEGAHFMNYALKLMGPEAKLRGIFDDLRDAVFKAIMNDVILLCPGSHSIINVGGITTGGAINGMLSEGKPKPVITDAEAKWSLLEVFGGSFELKNVGVNISNCQQAITVRDGILNMENVTIITNTTTNAQGIVVDTGATLNANECDFYGFTVAIVCLPGSNVNLTNCNFENCRSGLRIVEQARVKISSCVMKEDIKIPIRYEAENCTSSKQPLEFLSSLDEIITDELEVGDCETPVHCVQTNMALLLSPAH